MDIDGLMGRRLWVGFGCSSLSMGRGVWNLVGLDNTAARLLSTGRLGAVATAPHD